MSGYSEKPAKNTPRCTRYIFNKPSLQTCHLDQGVFGALIVNKGACKLLIIMSMCAFHFKLSVIVMSAEVTRSKH